MIALRSTLLVLEVDWIAELSDHRDEVIRYIFPGACNPTFY